MTSHGQRACVRVNNEFAVALWVSFPPSDREDTGSIPTRGAFSRSSPKTPSTGNRPRKQTRARFYKPEAFDAVELK
ncbi:hypothetical protein DPMN_156732 [Dreissena polymorpha]|uniref:Uncharacterized protein n=1 Tax=Dreissena polymorpha TaxID=45954 RepID=A0A9D4FPH6_DREPO|nr:hypothetical protein DPMN_156732 [Dreissena polymorpha]